MLVVMKVRLEDLIKEIGNCGVYKEGVNELNLYEVLKRKYEIIYGSECRGRGRPRKSKVEKVIVDKMSFLVSEQQKEESIEESIKVKKEIIYEKVYLISESDDIYDFESHEHIGMKKNGKVVLFEKKNDT